jgi:hypothetical protein
MWSLCAWFAFYTVLIVFAGHTALGLSLTRSYLGRDYNEFLRPLQNLYGAVDVNISLTILAANKNDVNAVTGELNLPAIFTVILQEERMGWKPFLTGESGSMNVPYGYMLWNPPVLIGNRGNLSRNGYDQDDYQYLRVVYNGTIVWDPANIENIACSLDTTYFLRLDWTFGV